MIKYKGKVLTLEQESHINSITGSSNDFAIQAPPGSGKTFLLLALARKMSRHGLSVSFNKLLAIESAKKFTSSVECKTGHSLAYSAVGYKYKKRLKKLTGKLLAETEDIGDPRLYKSPANKGYLILNTIRKYCYSADLMISKKHLPLLTILDTEDIIEMQNDLIQVSTNVFQKMLNLESDLPITHDVYLKAWALTNPIINKDYIFFDEYQDSNPVISDIIKSQKCQKIFVGDQFQQIYSWRGAINALKDRSLETLNITQSFRFGHSIADLCNKIITSYYPINLSYTPFRGNDNIQSNISYDPLHSVDCIICRTNKSVIAETINALKNDQNVHIHGGTQALTYLINSIHWLKVKGTTNHPDLFLFSNYKELLEYAKSDMGGDLLPIIKLIETYTHDRLISILESTKEDPAEADITITTAHKAKGLEWPTVKLANDFKVATPDYTPSDEETNILYVAASRALNTLDISGCPACWNPSFSQAIKNNQENYKLAKLTNIE